VPEREVGDPIFADRAVEAEGLKGVDKDRTQHRGADGTGTSAKPMAGVGIH
jgi:hypothetical protein